MTVRVWSHFPRRLSPRPMLHLANRLQNSFEVCFRNQMKTFKNLSCISNFMLQKYVVSVSWEHFMNIPARERRKQRSAQCTVGQNVMKSTRRVLGHSLVHLIVSSHCSLIRFLRTALICLLARSLTRSRAHGKEACFF